MLVRQAAVTDKDTNVCLLIHQQVLFATFIVSQDSRPSQCSADYRHQTWSSQPQTELVYAAIIRCHVLGYSCTVSLLSTVMWNSVDIGQRIIYSWICQNCTSQHLAITSASTPPRLLYKQGAVVSPVSLQTFAKILFNNIYYLIYVYISTWLLGFVQIYFSSRRRYSTP